MGVSAPPLLPLVICSRTSPLIAVYMMLPLRFSSRSPPSLFSPPSGPFFVRGCIGLGCSSPLLFLLVLFRLLRPPFFLDSVLLEALLLPSDFFQIFLIIVVGTPAA